MGLRFHAQNSATTTFPRKVFLCTNFPLVAAGKKGRLKNPYWKSSKAAANFHKFGQIFGEVQLFKLVVIPHNGNFMI